MKSTSRMFVFLLLAALPFTLLSQGQTVVAAYMKVPHGMDSQYLEIENAWRIIHQKAVEAGVYNGWQLWRNVHAGADDPYQYITLQWYDDYEHYFGENVSQDWAEGLFTDQEAEELTKKTLAVRTYAYEEVSNLVTKVDNQKPLKYLVVARMKVKPGMEQEYVDMERDIFKPYREELINRGYLAHWGVWNIWPYKDGQYRYVVVNGYADAAQLTADGVIIQPEELGLDYTMEEIMALVQKTRVIAQVELWELLDQVWPEE